MIREIIITDTLERITNTEICTVIVCFIILPKTNVTYSQIEVNCYEFYFILIYKQHRVIQ